MNTTRRNFLKRSAILTAALAFPRISCAVPHRAEALIVGAGIAGLAAARRLADADVRVLILEARERVGGRLWSLRGPDGHVYDMGASWIHGQDGNPIAKMARQSGIVATESPNQVQLFGACGEMLDPKERDAMGARLLRRARRAIRSDADSLDAVIARSRVRDALSARERSLFQSFLHSSIEQEYAADISDLSAKHFDSDEESPGEDLMLPGGYDRIATVLAAGLDIHFGQCVRRIASEGSRISVETTHERFTADFAIVTLPLGVLKSGDIVFDPPLPLVKQQAIARLGMGLLNKVWLRFPQPFWPQPGWIERAVPPNAWAEYYAMPLPEPTVIAFTCGSHARSVEHDEEEKIVSAALTGLRACFGSSVPEPLEWHITRWQRDPFSRGAYSYIAAGAVPADRAHLAAPVGRIFFAGEACHTRFPATVHGAYLSGLDAASLALSSFT